MSDCTLLSTTLSDSEKKSLLENLKKCKFVYDGFIGKLSFNINQGGITNCDKIDLTLSLDGSTKKLIIDEFKKSRLIHSGFTGKLLLDIGRNGAVGLERTDKLR